VSSGRPLIAITSCSQRKGLEFRDESVSLSLDYARKVAAFGGTPLVVPNLELDAAALLARIDGLILTGGGDVETSLFQDAPGPYDDLATLVDLTRDRLEIDLCKQAMETCLPIFGICRGIQILNVAMGGTLYIDIPSEVTDPVNHRESDRPREGVHHITIDSSSRLHQITGLTTVEVNSTHHQAVKDLAPSLTATATTSDGIIEAVEVPGHPFLIAVQFHPERLLREGKNLFDPLWAEFLRVCARQRA